MVAVSIKPLHAITGAITHGAGTPQLLFNANVSPHDYALRPSIARSLSDADLIIWVGPELETSLTKPIEALSSPDRSLVLLDQPGITVLSQRRQNSGHDHGPGGRDPHIWLDPINAIAIAQVITRRLSELDPAGSTLYQDNLAQLTQRLGAAHSKISVMMQPLADRSLAITHDSMQYFEARYGLQNIIYLSHLPSVLPGAKRLSAVRDEIRAQNTQCVLAEPQLGVRWVRALKEDQDINSGTLDILGATLKINGNIEGILLNVANTITICLSAGT